MQRREFVALLAGAALTWPLTAYAQQSERNRRIGVLLGWVESDPEARLNLAAFREGLAVLGWVEGRNLQIDLRWGTGDADRASLLAKELVALRPELIFCTTTAVTAALQSETRTIPIVFSVVVDPVGSGFVKTLARPGSNLTGLLFSHLSLAEKWIQLLKQIASRVTRAAVMFNPKTTPYGTRYMRPLNAAAAKLGVKAHTATVSNEIEIEQTIAKLAREPGGGLVVMADSFNYVHRKLIIALTARHKVAAIYGVSKAAEEGGLVSYVADPADLCRRAAPYVDRILRGEKPNNLPVQQPNKFELVVNKKTAKELGLKIPLSMLIRADRVIE